MTQQEIQTSLDAMPSYMPIRAIERKLKMPATTLQKAAKGERDLPSKWIKPLQDFFGLKKTPQVVPEVESATKSPVVKKTALKQPLATSQVVKKAHKAMGQQVVFVESKKSYGDYMKMTGAKIKEHWEEIKKSNLTPGQRATLYSKMQK